MNVSSFQRISHDRSGFTLIEVMIVVAIIAILAAIALPNYSDYVLRAKLVEATNTLSAARANMEQYYQDNRTYVTSDTIPSACDAKNLLSLNGSLKNFSIACVYTPTTYTILATGINAASGFTFTVTDANVQSSSTVPPSPWGTASYTCWVTKRGMTC